MSLEAKVVAGLVVAIILAAGGAWGYHAIWASGHDAGAAEKQIEFDRFKSDLANKADAEKTANEQAEAEATRLKQEEDDRVKAQLAALAADRDQFATRLRNALAGAGPHPNAPTQVPGQPGTAQAGGQSCDASAGRLSGLIADARAECLANDARLDALVEEVLPQANRGGQP